MKKKKTKKGKYPTSCGKGKRGCKTILTIVAGRHCSISPEELMQTNMIVIAGKGCHRHSSWETMTGKSFESRLAA